MNKYQFGDLLLEVIPVTIILTCIILILMEKRSNPLIGLIVYNCLILILCVILWGVVSIFASVAYWQILIGAYSIVLIGIVVNALRRRKLF